jgi:hypothetical protein
MTKGYSVKKKKYVKKFSFDKKQRNYQNIILKCQRIAEQKFRIRHAKCVGSSQWIRSDVDRHDAAIHDDLIGRDIAGNEKKTVLSNLSIL